MKNLFLFVFGLIIAIALIVNFPRVVVTISGLSLIIYGINLLRKNKEIGIESQKPFWYTYSGSWLLLFLLFYLIGTNTILLYVMFSISVILTLLIVIGLIKPTKALKFSKIKTRKHVIVVYGITLLLVIVSTGFFVPKTPKVNSSTAAVTKPVEVTPLPVKKYSKLSIDSVQASNGNITVSGSTDLPDEAVLNVSFDVKKDTNESFSGVTLTTKVIGGKYTADIHTPTTDSFKKGSYLTKVYFSTVGQSDAVIKAVGTSGENLTGSLSKGSSMECLSENSLTIVDEPVKEVSSVPSVSSNSSTSNNSMPSKPSKVSKPSYRTDGPGPNGETIKGNHSSSGEKIYHVPGGAYYDRTKAEEWFFTEEQAQAAGYRASKR